MFLQGVLFEILTLRTYIDNGEKVCFILQQITGQKCAVLSGAVPMLSENFPVLVVKFSVYLNRHVFLM